MRALAVVAALALAAPAFAGAVGAFVGHGPASRAENGVQGFEGPSVGRVLAPSRTLEGWDVEVDAVYRLEGPAFGAGSSGFSLRGVLGSPEDGFTYDRADANATLSFRMDALGNATAWSYVATVGAHETRWDGVLTFRP